jgi:hypothetical protein
VQDPVILARQHLEARAGDGGGDLFGRRGQPGERVRPGDRQQRRADARQPAGRQRGARLEERVVVGQRVGQAGEVAPQVAVPHALDHLGRQTDHLGLEQRGRAVPFTGPDERGESLGGVWGGAGT